MKRRAAQFFNIRFSWLAMLLMVVSITALAIRWETTTAMAVPKTWSGAGATNNWSEAANWSDSVVPGSGDTVTFDGTSTKDATIDISISISGIQINSGYAGTITQANGT